MKKLLIPALQLILLMLFTTWRLHAQDGTTIIPPDYTKIQQLTADKSGAYYYPKLMKRYANNDTTLSVYELHLLYYGAFFNDQDNIGQFTNLDINDSIKLIAKKDNVTDADKQQLIRLYLIKNKSNPFDLETLNVLYNLYEMTNSPLSGYYRFKVTKLYDVILSTGDGRSTKSGFHVNSVPDEYSIVSALGFTSNGSQSLVDMCDYLEVNKNEYDVPGIYFDVAQIFKGYEKMFSKDSLKIK